MDNDADIDTNDSADNLPHRLPLGDQEQFGAAIANEKFIRDTAKMLQSLADFNVEVDQEEKNTEAKQRELKRSVSVRDYFSSCTRKVFETLDIVLDWLEQSAKDAKEEMKKKSDKIQAGLHGDKTDAGETEDNVDGRQLITDDDQKKEVVLRGLYHITDLGSYTCFVGLLELVSKFLDLPENPYKAKREYVKKCLKAADEQQQKVFELVEKACDLLQEITREPVFNQRKAGEFNSTVRQADVFIESCKDLLDDAEKTIDELMKIMSIMKTVSRGLRFAGFGVTCYGLYHTIPSTSTVDSLAAYVPATGLTLMRGLALNRGVKTVGFVASCAVAGFAWLSLFPSKAYAFRNDLEELKLKHKSLTRALRSLEKRLKTVNEDFREKAKEWSNREDSV